jgi:integrase
MFKAALNWACQKYERGQPLLQRHVLEKFRIPAEKDPKRPVIDELTIKALLSVAQDVHPFLQTMIVLAWRTGRRLSSILSLRWEDVDFENGTIRWRAEHDKIRQTWVVPMHREVRAELIQLRKRYPGIGPSLLSSLTRSAGGITVGQSPGTWPRGGSRRRSVAAAWRSPQEASGTRSDASGRPSGRIYPSRTSRR